MPGADDEQYIPQVAQAMLKEQIEDSEITETIRGAEPVAHRIIQFLSNARTSFSACADARAPSVIIAIEPFKIAILSSIKRAVQHRYITEITKDNLEHCKALIEFGVELRHLDKMKGNFAVSENQYAATSTLELAASPPELIFSNARSFVEQQAYLFQTLWNQAVDASARIREIEENRPRYATKIVHDPYEILTRTKEMAETSTRYSVSSVSGGLLYAYNHAFDQFEQILGRHNRGEHQGIRWITTIDDGCIEVAKKFLELGMEIRHLQNVPTESFGLSETEVGVTLSRLDGGSLNTSALLSNDPLYVDHYALVFEEQWNNGVDARVKIKELEEGIEEAKMVVLRDKTKLQELYLRLIDQAKDEILLILPSSNAYNRHVEIGVIDALETAAAERHVKVSLLVPGTDAKDQIQKFNRQQDGKAGASEKNPINLKSIIGATTPNAVIVLVVDRIASLIMEVHDDSQPVFKKAVGVGTYSTRGSTVKANVRFFERLWEDELLLERERRSRREAELLQDILAHDLANYNQITLASAELMKDATFNAPRAEHDKRINEILRAVTKSNELIERAKKLGRILSEDEFMPISVGLEDVLRRSVEIVIRANPRRPIDPVYSMEWKGAEVLADDFLEDVFVNILSNSVKYTDGERVPFEIRVEEAVDQEEQKPNRKRFWKVIFTDYGRGIPDELKSKAFTRYLRAASGSGLGLSIVYALVVERYSGIVKIRDRVKGEHRQGTVIEAWLPVAE